MGGRGRHRPGRYHVGLVAHMMNASKTIGSLVKADPRFDTLIAPDTELEVLANGYDWSEGPVWSPATVGSCCGRTSPPTPSTSGNRATQPRRS